MGFHPESGKFYRMPVFFGPMSGPRQWPEGRSFDFTRTPKVKMLGARYLTEAAPLAAMLPDRFALWGEPIVSVETYYMTEIGWLAGRGYNMCDVKFDVVYQSADGPVHGTLVLVRWENLADPIVSGREELGHNKLYCEIPELAVLDGRLRTTMGWLGTPFLDVAAFDLQPATKGPGIDPLHKGMLSYKYIPKTGEWGQADVEYVTLTPHFRRNVTVTSFSSGQGEVRFRRATWEELPTLYHIVNVLEALPVRQSLGGYLVETIGGSSVAETVRLP